MQKYLVDKSPKNLAYWTFMTNYKKAGNATYKDQMIEWMRKHLQENLPTQVIE